MGNKNQAGRCGLGGEKLTEGKRHCCDIVRDQYARFAGSDAKDVAIWSA